MNKRAYIMTQGEYSDRLNCGVFLDKEKAEKFAKENDCDIDVVDFEPTPLSELYPAGWLVYYVTMNRDGSLAWKTYTTAPHVGRHYGPVFIKRTIANAVVAKDEAHAVKITNDLRVKAIAEGRL